MGEHIYTYTAISVMGQYRPIISANRYQLGPNSDCTFLPLKLKCQCRTFECFYTLPFPVILVWSGTCSTTTGWFSALFVHWRKPIKSCITLSGFSPFSFSLSLCAHFSRWAIQWAASSPPLPWRKHARCLSSHSSAESLQGPVRISAGQGGIWSALTTLRHYFRLWTLEFEI